AFPTRRSSDLLGQGAAVLAHLLGAQVADERVALADQLLGGQVEHAEVVRGVAQAGPLEAQPAHVVLDRLHELRVFLFRIGVVEAQVTQPAELLGDAEVQADRLGVADVQVAVGLGRKAGPDRGMLPAGQVVADDLADEVLLAGGGRCGACRGVFGLGHAVMGECRRGPAPWTGQCSREQGGGGGDRNCDAVTILMVRTLRAGCGPGRSCRSGGSGAAGTGSIPMLSRPRDAKSRGDGLWHLAGLLFLAGLVVSALAAASGMFQGEAPAEVVLATGTAGPGVETAAVRFDLPPRRADGDRWVAWFPRSAREAVWLEAPGWRSPEQSFYEPGPAEGLLPGGYSFPLPADWEGPVEVTLHARPALGGTWQARIMSASDAARLEQALAGASAAIYGSLLMLAMLALSLYAAARDRVFLTLFACTATVAAMLAAINGHLYAFPGLRVLAHLRTAGLWALVFLFLATWLR